MKYILSALLVLNLSLSAAEKLSYPSLDGLEVTADLYALDGKAEAPVIILFHQARYSRGAYQEIAPKLNKLGFRCLAVDARSGKEVNGVVNETAARAKKKGKAMEYRDALPDLKASVAYAHEKFPKAPILIWGSSYSASMVFAVAAEHPEEVKGLLSFSPNFPRWKPEEKAAASLAIPVFVTSSKKEVKNWKSGFEKIKSEKKTGFEPKGAGRHGSSTLWESEADNEEYWEAVTKFLKENFVK